MKKTLERRVQSARSYTREQAVLLAAALREARWAVLPQGYAAGCCQEAQLNALTERVARDPRRALSFIVGEPITLDDVRCWRRRRAREARRHAREKLTRALLCAAV